MPDTVMTVTGLDALVKKLERLGRVDLLRPVLKAAGSHIKSVISVYPPSSEANVPNQRRWYERGWGSKWMRRDGTVNGRKTSETLGRKWTVKSSTYTATIGNNASYAPYVHDPDEQASFHEARGWKTTEQVANSERVKVEKFVLAEVEKALKG